MPKQDDKHSMAEDYLAQIKWHGEHPYRKGATPRKPDWKYTPVYARPKHTSYSFKKTFVTVLLLALIGVLGYAILEMIFVSHTSLAYPIIALVLLALLLFVAREPKQPSSDN